MNYINKKHIIKYLIQLLIVSLSVYLLSPCNISYNLSILVGLISSSIFAILDIMFPLIIKL